MMLFLNEFISRENKSANISIFPVPLQCVRKKCVFFIIQAAYLNNVRHLESRRVRDILPFLPTVIYKYYCSNNEEDIQQMKKTKGSCSAALWRRQSQHGVPMMDHTPQSLLAAELSKWISMELHALENAQQWDTEWSAVKEHMQKDWPFQI